MIGIYIVTNTVTGQNYIGRAVKVEQRLNQHRRGLRLKIHENPFLQNSYNKYGLESFTFRPLIQCRREDNPFYERLCIRGYKSDDPRFGFNLTIALEDVLTHTPKAKAAISAFQKVFQLTNHYEMTPEIAEKIASKLRGVPTGRKGIKFSAEKRARSGAPKGNTNRAGKSFTEESKRRISVSLEKYFLEHPEATAAISARKSGRPVSRSAHRGLMSKEATAALYLWIADSNQESK